MSALTIAQESLAPLQKQRTGMKLTQEFLDHLVENYSGQEFTLEQLQRDEVLMDFGKKKGKKASSGQRGRVKKSSEERLTEAYCPEKCNCRIFLKGFGVQCSSKKLDGEDMCRKHLAQVAEHGSWYLGSILDPRPEAPVRPGSKSGKPLVWKTTEDGEVIEKVKKEKKEKKPKEPKAPKEKKELEKAMEPKAPKAPKEKVPEEDELKKALALIAKHEAKKALVLEEESDSDTLDLPDGVESPKESPHSPKDEEFEEITFEGVEYRLYSNGKVTNDFSLEVGAWVKDEERIEFIDEEMEEEHNINRDE